MFLNHHDKLINQTYFPVFLADVIILQTLNLKITSKTPLLGNNYWGWEFTDTCIILYQCTLRKPFAICINNLFSKMRFILIFFFCSRIHEYL